jgi:hypothetical protein
MAKKESKKGLSSAEKVSIGLGLTAAAVTAAGAYFLYGSKEASQNRKRVKGWVLKAKGEILETLEKTKAITEEEYHELVNSATGVYGTVKSATKGEIKDFKREMQEHWNELQQNRAIKKIVTKPKDPVPHTPAAKKSASKKVAGEKTAK